MQLDNDDHQQLRKLMIENQRLLAENNQLLKKMNRRSILSFWFRLVWTLILIGAPFVLYFYIIEPYLSSLDSSLRDFQSGLQEIPGWKQFYQAVGGSE